MESADLKHVKHVALDMDGTIYQGSELFETTLPFLNLLSTLDIGYTFLTNNSSKSIRTYQKQLKKMGLDVKPETIYSSTLFALNYLEQEHPALKRLYILGTDSMREEVREAGFLDVDEEPDIVLVAFDSNLTYHRLCKAAYWVKTGAKFIATHPDPLCPTNQETLLIDCGCIISCLEKATGRQATILGKPNPGMLQTIARQQKLQMHEIAMAGDRLETDVKMARDAGALSVHIAPQNSEYASDIPSISVPHLMKFGEMLQGNGYTP